MGSKRAYRSKFEESIAEDLIPAGFVYEAYKILYFVEHNYTPDFSIGDIMVEAKGWFRPGDQKKYKAIRDSLESPEELVFFLQSPNKKVRKGANLTMSGWCEKEGIRWFACTEGLINYANS